MGWELGRALPVTRGERWVTCDSCEAIRRSVGNSEAKAKAKAEGEAKAGEALRYSRSSFDQKFSFTSLRGPHPEMLLPLDVNLSCHVRVKRPMPIRGRRRSEEGESIRVGPVDRSRGLR